MTAEVLQKTFTDERVFSDDRNFSHCTFDRCVIVYSGGPLPTMRHCTFNSCMFEFEGSAGRTLDMLKLMYHGGFQSLIDNTIEQLKKFTPPQMPDAALKAE